MIEATWIGLEPAVSVFRTAMEESTDARLPLKSPSNGA
jgi:hypothetical protein